MINNQKISKPAGLEVRVAQAEAALADLFARHTRVLLAFSGGKESIALARLCEPYEGRFRLIWGNTGFMFPHVEALVREYKGLQMADLGAPMLSIGLSATLIVSTAAGGTLEQADMRRHLMGRRAVFGVKVSRDDDSGYELHALAWTGTRLFDCRGPEVRELYIEEVTILAATILSAHPV